MPLNSLLARDNAEQGTSATQSLGILIPKQLMGTLFAKVKPKLIWRGLAAMVIGPSSIPGSSIDIDMQKAGNNLYIKEVYEGSEIPLQSDEYETFNVKPLKYGVRINITREMIEDSKFAIMEKNIMEAGFQMARNEESLILSTLDTGYAANSTEHLVSGGAAITIANIVTAMKFLREDHHTPTDFIIGVEVESDIRQIDTFVEADKAGVTDPSQSLIGRIFGMNVWVSTNMTATSSYVIDRGYAFLVAEKRPLTLERWDDFVRDGRQASLTQRFAARYWYKEAIAKITTS